MAYIARLPDYSRGAVAGESMTEGMAVVLTTSGTGVRNELPVAMKASQNNVNQIGIVIVPPDNFARPTPSTMYTAGRSATMNPNTGYADPVYAWTLYNVGKSTLWNPTLASGELALVCRGGTFAVSSGCYIMSAGILVPGSMIRVGTGGLWETTSTESQAVGIVEEFSAANQCLVITLWH